MCGITALFGSIEFSDSIQKMTDIIAHRGPDGEGVKRFSNQAHLGHRRLSILDLSVHGSQPMSTPDGRFHITYNGEIYNYLELKEELKKKGHCFTSHCDTEVLLAAFSEWGEGCLPKLNGMFAFVIYDAKKKTFFAARDRYGIKPLYYWRSKSGMLAFASEIKQFLTLPEFRPCLNRQRAYDFLNWAIHDHTSETLFADVYQLRGGYCCVGSAGSPNVVPKKWYSYRQSPYHGSLSEASAHFKDLLIDSISLRLRSDVSIGSCLSGGLDSSSIVCLVNDLLNQKEASEKQQTFSACSTCERIDERKYVEEVVRQTKHQAHYTTPDPQILLKELDRMIWHQDEPFETTSVFAQWEVFKLAKKHQVKVMLDGQGADEQLAGYTSCYSFLFSQLFRTFKWKALLNEIALSKPTCPHVNPWILLGSKMVPNFLKPPLKRLYRKPSENPQWLSLDRLDAEDRSPFAGVDRLTLPDYCRQMTFTSSLPMLLHFEDRNSMAHSIEARTPFLDWRLVEFSLNLPAEYKISQGLTKRLIRESMKEVIPQTIIDRRDKIGFSTAEEMWIRDPQFRKLLEEGIEKSQGIVRPLVLRDYDRMIEGKRPFSNHFWRVISFGRWLTLFQVNIIPETCLKVLV